LSLTLLINLSMSGDTKSDTERNMNQTSDVPSTLLKEFNKAI